MERYFPNLEIEAFQWLLNTFSAPDATVDDDEVPGKEQWIALRVSEAWKLKFHSMILSLFWIARLADTPALARRALKVPVSFFTTYFCEQGLAAVLGLKCRIRNKLDVTSDP